jgi:ankyrin repeat protein
MPLHYACYFGHESTVLVLLQNKANPNLQDDKVTS